MKILCDIDTYILYTHYMVYTYIRTYVHTVHTHSRDLRIRQTVRDLQYKFIINVLIRVCKLHLH